MSITVRYFAAVREQLALLKPVLGRHRRRTPWASCVSG